MLLLKTKPTIVQLQWLVWIFIFLILTLSLIPMDGIAQASVYALLNTCFYAAIIYGNILFLYPRLYQQKRVFFYALAVILFLVGIGALRAFVTLSIYNRYFSQHPEHMSLKAMISMTIGGLMIFLLSFVFRIVLAYFTLKKQSEEIIAQKTQAELNLLKSQVQPHFLFNTLNNIYYEAYLEAPRTAALIERLSDIMRYFVDDSPKERVSLQSEMQFIENYMELERIRMRYPVEIRLTKEFNAATAIPPMLLMTFTENIFKHGIDKSSTRNQIDISLSQQHGQLIFTTTNTIPQEALTASSSGFGIENLRKRLVLLYGKDFELNTQSEGGIFTAYLNIPLI